MTLANGRPYMALPGPSVVPDRVLRAMHRPSPNIYGGPLHALTDSLYPDLQALAGTAGKATIYIGNGHAGWEAALANTLSRGDRVLVLVTGLFGHGWADAAARMGIRAETLDFGRRDGIDPDRVADALAADRAHEIRAVLMVHVDTATTIRSDVRAVRRVLDDTGHPALLMVDCIASLACDAYEMDAFGADVTVAASQKGLMNPAGLAFLWFNDRAAQAHERAGLVTPYWDWLPRSAPQSFYQLFCGTAPAQQLYGLREALDMILHEEGLAQVWQRHATLARAVHAAVEVWSRAGAVALNLSDPALRSHAVTSVRIAGGGATRVRNWAERQAGLVLGIGLGMESDADPGADDWLRIAHMGHVNAHMVLGALGVIEAGLQALDIPHEAGGVAAAAQVVAAG